MSAADSNVEVVRRLFETYNEAGAAAIVERKEEFVDPEIEWKGVAASSSAPGGGTVYRGHEGVRRFWAEMDEVFDSVRIDPVEIEALGDEVVVALLDVTGSGRASGVELRQEMGSVYRFRGGRILAGENFASHDEARAAARALHGEGVDAQA